MADVIRQNFISDSIEEASTLSESCRHGLQSSSTVLFFRALREAAKVWQNGSSAEQAVIDAFLAVAGSTSISEMEQDKRAQLIMREVPEQLLCNDVFLARLGELPRYIKNGIACSLPPEHRPAFFGKRSNDSKSSISSIVISNEAVKTTQLERQIDQEEQKSREGVVLLLASRATQEVEANLSLLKSDGFDVYRVPTKEQLNIYLSQVDVCGFVIDGSFWEGSNSDEQANVLKSVAAYSSMICLVVDETNFVESRNIRDIIDEQRHTPATHHELHIRGNSRLIAGDLECFHRSADGIAPLSRPQLLMREFTDDEIVALTAAAAAFRRDELMCRKPLTELSFVVMAGGNSNAKVVQMYFEQNELPVIVKVACKEHIIQEAERYREYIIRRSTNGYLKPHVYFHGTVGIAIFSLVGDSTKIDAPARKLEYYLNLAWQQEIWGIVKDNRTLNDTCTIIEHIAAQAAERLGFLNKSQCPMPPKHDPYGYLKGDGLRTLLTTGVLWTLPYLSSDDVCNAIDHAHQVLDRLGDCATIHGDINLCNILCQDRNAFLIDFSFSGPGHPACDLVRLECALIYRYLRQLDTEETFMELQRAMSLDLATKEELEAKFPIWFSSRLNRSLLTVALACRDICLDVLSKYNANQEQYIAAKFIMSCHSTDIAQLQIGLIRGTLRALAPAVSKL